MNSDSPLLVTESVTIVVPGYFLQYNCISHQSVNQFKHLILLTISETCMYSKS